MVAARLSFLSREKAKLFAKRTVVFGGSAGVIAALFPHFEDEYWYRVDPERVTKKTSHSSPAETFLEDDKKHPKRAHLPKLVVLGTGWGSVAALQSIDRDKYDITVVSPRNSFLFTPLLPSTAVGTLSHNSVAQPIRDITSYKSSGILQRLGYMWRGYLPPCIQYAYAQATDIDPLTKKIRCKSVGKYESDEFQFDIPYDKLLVCVGCNNNTWNTPGVNEHCHYLKESGDAILIRQKLIENLELASLPGTPEKVRERLLSFYVIGGGPTGVEFAAELSDFMKEDVSNERRSLFRGVQSNAGNAYVKLVQSGKKLLPGFAPSVQDFCLQHMKSNENMNCVDVLTETRVTKVTKDHLSLYDKKTKTTKNVPYGMVVWSTGVTPTNIAKAFMKKLPKESQKSKRAIQIDQYCRVLGAPDVFAVGDCSDIDLFPEYLSRVNAIFDTILQETTLVPNRNAKQLNFAGNEKFLNVIKEKLNTKFHGDQMGYKVAEKIVDDIERRFLKAKQDVENHEKSFLGGFRRSSTVAECRKKAKELTYNENATTPDNKQSDSDLGYFRGLDRSEVEEIVKKHVRQQTMLPPTAQVAQQQGVYVAGVLNAVAQHNESDESKAVVDDLLQKSVDKFAYKNRGQLVYVGDNVASLALPGSNDTDFTSSGRFTNLFWHAAYFQMLDSTSGRYALFVDWLKCVVFGRSTAVPAICTDNSRQHDALLTRRAMP